MKKLLLLFSIMMFVTACNTNKTSKDVETVDSTIVDSLTVDSVVK